MTKLKPRVGCGKSIRIGDTLWSKWSSERPATWRKITLCNSSYVYCGHNPHKLETVICYECAVKKGLVW